MTRRLVVLGQAGMLGSEVIRVAKESDLQVVGVGRDHWNFEREDTGEFLNALSLGPEDTIVNCVGWIPQKASGDPVADSFRAQRLNIDLLRHLASITKTSGTNWVQIGTDCAFDGSVGNYNEDSEPNAIDLYSQTKVRGEQHCEQAVFIRCSIVGWAGNGGKGLFNWAYDHLDDEKVPGFTNHVWNGVTTTAFARLVVGIHVEGPLKPMKIHWVPKDFVTKYELLRIFYNHLGRKIGNVSPVMDEVSINRTLSTLHREMNEKLWKIAGYAGPQEIDKLCEEFISASFANEKSR